MEREPNDKVIVITGGAKGIGFEIADHFLECGAKTLILLDNSEAAGVTAAQTLNKKYGKDKVVFIQCDITKDLEKVSSHIFEKYEVDVLINNAGVLDESDLRKTIEINCIALIEWSMKFFEHWRVDQGGRGGTIFNVASIYGFEYNPFAVYYKTSKHAVLGFTRSLGHPFNYNITGVRVIVICPGFTETALLAGKSWEIHKEEFQKQMEEKIIMQKPKVVGKAAVEIFGVADSGTAWVAANNEPIKLAPMC
ncbi:15-hydroxyprostaglandin dehydrogenase [NAD(+)]-like [Helicoverpa zea]|uniref:15-hydroxyprostaglandin dehydrogenase [NAD(+)]-like n=1 Tax=Helicoverpa zea TaxID=7113 RepID=UPI001F55CAAE|nr:15-hydroxyprostaglandin dehydrogenase [NAD(+)]-like [Helicoverpa zea]